MIKTAICTHCGHRIYQMFYFMWRHQHSLSHRCYTNIPEFIATPYYYKEKN